MVLRPGDFTRQLLKALEASEGRTRRRKRDQTPDTIGLGIKRELLTHAAADDPGPEDFESWLMERVLAEPASGGVRAMCTEILDEYHLAAADLAFYHWLEEGAPSADGNDGAEPGSGPRRRGRIPLEMAGDRNG